MKQKTTRRKFTAEFKANSHHTMHLNNPDYFEAGKPQMTYLIQLLLFPETRQVNKIK